MALLLLLLMGTDAMAYPKFRPAKVTDELLSKYMPSDEDAPLANFSEDAIITIPGIIPEEDLILPQDPARHRPPTDNRNTPSKAHLLAKLLRKPDARS